MQAISWLRSLTPRETRGNRLAKSSSRTEAKAWFAYPLARLLFAGASLVLQSLFFGLAIPVREGIPVARIRHVTIAGSKAVLRNDGYKR